MTIRPPKEFRQLLAETNPLRWSFDAWASIAVVSTAIVFALGLILCLLSFAFPPLGVLLLGLLGSLLVGLAIAVVVVPVLWAALTPMYWLAHWLAWRMKSGGTGGSSQERRSAPGAACRGR